MAMRREGKGRLRDEIRCLRQAIEDIKRDLPIGESRSQGKSSEELDEGLMSFRPAKPRLQDLGTEMDPEFPYEPVQAHTTKSSGTYKEASLQRDLQDIKEKIDSLRFTFVKSEESLKSSPQEKEVQTQIVDIRTNTEKHSKGKQERLLEEFSKLQAENQVLRDILSTQSRSPPRQSSSSHKSRPKLTKGKKKPGKIQCDNCAFLRVKGFESGLCYRHRANSSAYASTPRK